jgi:HAD superfamily hydrolase (TIGR01450 family)
MDSQNEQQILSYKEVFKAYKALYPPLPSIKMKTLNIKELKTLNQDFDLFIFDSDGVLKKGKQVISAFYNWCQELSKLGKSLHLLSNASSFSKKKLHSKHQNMGYPFTLEQISCPRDLLESALNEFKELTRWGVLIPEGRDLPPLLHKETIFLAQKEAFFQADAFLLISAGTWTPKYQLTLIRALKERPRPVLVLNPDVAAPKESYFSAEWGYYLKEIQDINPQTLLLGKPYPKLFESILKKYKTLPSRTLMIGDTLHTDILGAQKLDIKTLFVETAESSKIKDKFSQTNIYPDFRFLLK